MANDERIKRLMVEAYKLLIKERPSCSIEAVKMSFENPFAHGRRSPTWSTAIDTKSGRTSCSRTKRRSNGHFAIGTDGSVWRRRRLRWRRNAIRWRGIRRLRKRISKRKSSKQACGSVLLTIGHDWDRRLLAKSANSSSTCSPSMRSNRYFCIRFLFFKHRGTTREFAIERESSRSRFSGGLGNEIR